MFFYRDKETGEVYAYDEGQMSVIERINAPDFDNDKEQVPAIFFEIDEKIKSMHKMTAEEIELHINPPVTKEQQIDLAEGKKRILMAEARDKISVLEDAVDLGMATPEEESALKEWKKYRVLLSRVDASLGAAVVWATPPA